MRTGTWLTGRGVTLLCLGLISSVAAAMIGEPDLLRVTLAIAILPLGAVAYLLLAPPRVGYTRSLSPATVPVGESSRIVLHIADASPAQASALRFTDQAAPSLGGGAAFTIARGFGTWRQAVGYSVTTESRGRFTLGPLACRATDALALARRTVMAVGEPSQLRVTPRVWQLGDLAGGTGLSAAGDATAQRIGQAGADDVLVREHRHGDDIRRVHWKMSAKQDDLMVRLEEHPWDPSSTLILDTRADAHLGEGPQGSLEWVVSAVTSIAALLASGRHRLTVISPAGVEFDPGRAAGEAAKEMMLEAMTDVTASAEPWLGAAVADPERLTSTASIVAATGLLSVNDAAALAAAGARARSLVALVPDAEAWDAPDEEHREACSMLRNLGWTVESYRPGEPVPEVWERATR